MRVDYGPGYREYYAQADRVVFLLPCGGTKGTQGADIKRAIEMNAARAPQASELQKFARYDSPDYLKTPANVAE